MISELILIIQNQFISKSMDYEWQSYDPYLDEKSIPILERNNKQDSFKLNISMNSEIMVSGCFEGNRYSPKIRYRVDIKPIVPLLIDTIRFYSSSKMDYDLITNFPC